MTAVLATPRTLSLREDFHRGQRTKLRVDRDARVIFHVKILGWESANKRRYLPAAGKKALPLYENTKCYANHPDGRPTSMRSVEDMLGVWHNPVYESDGIYADLHYLESHPTAARVCEDAERGLGLFGASHNADGRGEYEGGVLVVGEITEVRSVDLVTEPATVTNLWESADASGHEHKGSGPGGGQFTGGGGGGGGGDGKGKAGGKSHSVALPKNKKKITIPQAAAALKEMGYKLGPAKTRHHEGAWITEYEVTHPDGKVSRASVDAVRELAYQGQAKSKQSAKEGKDMRVAVKNVLLEKVLPALKAGRAKRLQALAEKLPDTLEMTEAGVEGPGSGDHRDHMYGAMRACEEADDFDSAKSIHKLLAPKEKEDNDDDSDSDSDSDSDEEDPVKEQDDADEPDANSAAEEGKKRRKAPAPGAETLTEARILRLCKSSGIEATAAVMDALTGLDLDHGLAMLELLPKRHAPVPSSPPRSAPRGGVAVTEGVAPRDAEGWAKRLLG